MGRKSAVGTVVLLVLLAGCSTIGQVDDPVSTETVTTTEKPGTTVVRTGTETTVAGGKLFAYVVADPPPNATVVAYSDPRVDNSTLLRRVLEQAVSDEDGAAAANINAEERTALNQDLSDVPLYRGDESGYYIRYRNETIQVVVAKFA